jgi:hypothetical protein
MVDVGLKLICYLIGVAALIEYGGEKAWILILGVAFIALGTRKGSE